MPKKARTAKVKRKTTETDIKLELNLDGKGSAEVSTGIAFFDHMLTLLAKHALFGLTIKAKGDIDVDYHHTVEDVGLCLGEALKKALGDKKGLVRYGTAEVPMMDSLSKVTLDLSGRPYFKITPNKDSMSELYRVHKLYESDRFHFDLGFMEEFMQALANSAGMDLHITLYYGKDLHHAIESIFKALAKALKNAVEIDPRIEGVMSTKGTL
ncbi:MAG: imidazoleglycerol-phosphate dehydratase HisB [Deltaproteobacteria bacterium]|nr:imidazoleglycerol-phosphate dehydratase HisB [Deltaproteobacteria bacterium]